MFGRFGRHGIFSNQRAFVFHLQFGTDGIFRRPVVRIFRIFYIRPRPGHHHVGVREYREKTVSDQSVKSLFFIEKKHPVPVEIPQVIIQFPRFWQSFVRIHRCHKLIIGIGIIEGILSQSAFGQHPLQSASDKSAHPASAGIVLNTGKISSQVVFHTASKIF